MVTHTKGCNGCDSTNVLNCYGCCHYVDNDDLPCKNTYHNGGEYDQKKETEHISHGISAPPTIDLGSFELESGFEISDSMHNAKEIAKLRAWSAEKQQEEADEYDGEMIYPPFHPMSDGGKMIHPPKRKTEREEMEERWRTANRLSSRYIEKGEAKLVNFDYHKVNAEIEISPKPRSLSERLGPMQFGSMADLAESLAAFAGAGVKVKDLSKEFSEAISSNKAEKKKDLKRKNESFDCKKLDSYK